jgi:hypothetical protein
MVRRDHLKEVSAETLLVLSRCVTARLERRIVRVQEDVYDALLQREGNHVRICVEDELREVLL